MANNSKRRGMSPVLSFILGFLLALIIFVGAIVGVVFFVINYKLDKLAFNKTEDEEGNPQYKYVNANPDTGGAETVMDLINKITELAGEKEQLSLAKIEALLPVVSTEVTDKLIVQLNEYMELDEEELKNTVFAELGQYMSDKVMEIRAATLMSKMGAAPENKIIDLIINGKEADYVVNGEEQYPVYYDVYKLREDGSYIREVNDEALSDYETRLSEEYAELLTERGESYRLYYFHYKNSNYITLRGEDNNFIFDTSRVYADCVESVSHLTGAYYTENGERVDASPITIGSFADGSAFESLYEVPVTDLLKESGGNELTDKVLGGITLGELMDGEADFNEIINDIGIADVLDIDPDNNILVYIGYGITGVERDKNVYTGLYTDESGAKIKCFIENVITQQGNLKVESAYYFEGQTRVEIHSTLIGELNPRVKNITKELALSDVLDIKEPTEKDNNSLMLFLAFSVTEAYALSETSAEYAQGFAYGGIYHDKDGNEIPCYLRASGGKITGAYIDIEGEFSPAEKTSIEGVSEQVTRLKATLKLKDLMKIDSSNKILYALGDSTIDELPSFVDSLTINELYSDSIYCLQTEETESSGSGTAELYLAVKDAVMSVADGYDENLIYYTLEEDGGYKLAGTMGKLTAEDFAEGTFYTPGAGKILFDEAFLYYTEYGDSYKLYEGAEKGKVTSAEFEEGVYYTYGSPNALWKLLVYVASEDGQSRSEKAYTVNNLTSMISNVKKNTKGSTMYELDEAGIIEMSKANLDRPVNYQGKTCVGELTLEQLINLFLIMVSTMG